MSETPRTLSEPKSYTDLEYAVMYKSRCEKLEAELADAKAKLRKLSRKNRRAVQTARHFANRSRGAG